MQLKLHLRSNIILSDIKTRSQALALIYQIAIEQLEGKLPMQTDNKTLERIADIAKYSIAKQIN